MDEQHSNTTQTFRMKRVEAQEDDNEVREATRAKKIVYEIINRTVNIA